MAHNDLLRQLRAFLLCVCLLVSLIVTRGVTAEPKQSSFNEELTGRAANEKLVAPRQELAGPNQVIAQAQLPDGRLITRASSTDPNELVRVLVQLPGQPVALYSVERFNRLQGLTTGEVEALEEHGQTLEAERAAFLQAASRPPPNSWRQPTAWKGTASTTWPSWSAPRPIRWPAGRPTRSICPPMRPT